jgi:lysozyme
MKTNKAAIAILHEFESCKLKSYKCPAGVWTIGWGNTFYENGSKVLEGDIITQERADTLFSRIISQFEKDVVFLLKTNVNQNQFSALVSFSYNVGSDIDDDDIPEGLGDSTLLKYVNANPNDPRIRLEFSRWNKAKGKVLNGLTRRRAAEANLYFL